MLTDGVEQVDSFQDEPWPTVELTSERAARAAAEAAAAAAAAGAQNQ